MTKRRRDGEEEESSKHNDGEPALKRRLSSNTKHTDLTEGGMQSASIQIVTGSYERVLHGFTAKISFEPQNNYSSPSSVQFSDTFLFRPHASAIRCLALSPISDPSSSTQSPSLLLASGGTDERVNVYSLCASPPVESGKVAMPSLGGNRVSEDPRNRDLGSLMHHSSSITALYFPTRSKLLSAAEDNTIAITRTKDLSMVSTIKAPRPKVQGRPSGDTAALGAAPAGVNDFAIHSSMKLMLSVGKGERCMRLWNLVTAKKAGVLNFTRETLQSVHEGRYSSGEGRRIEWHPQGEEFAVAFERGIVVFGSDSRPRCKILPQPLTKLHQMRYLILPSNEQEDDLVVLAVSTENGRILFYSTQSIVANSGEASDAATLPNSVCLAQLDCNLNGVDGGRIKDFEILQMPSSPNPSMLAAVTAGSDGRVRVWSINTKDLISAQQQASRSAPSTTLAPAKQGAKPATTVGDLIGTCETRSRITCMRAFIMIQWNGANSTVLIDSEGLTEDGNTASEDFDGGD